MTIVPWKTRPELVRKILSIVENQERTLDYIAKDIELLYQIWIQAGRQIESPDIFRQLFQVWAERNIINVFEHTDVQSPIEQVFLNILIFVSLIEYPLGFVVTPPLTYQQRQVLKEQYLKNVALWNDEEKYDQEMDKRMQELHSSLLPAKDIIKSLKDYSISELLLAKYRLEAYHCTPQAAFPKEEIDVEGCSIRVDILIWKPDDPNVKVIVECDGYDIHHDPSADRLKHFKTFIKDRKRDRKLQDLGYCVRRYSGTEINNTPFECAADLIDFLMRRPVLSFAKSD